ncbi:hypothetical protein Tco_0806848 [Tanacetum coccineum]
MLNQIDNHKRPINQFHLYREDVSFDLQVDVKHIYGLMVARVVVAAAKMNQQTIDNDLESFFSFRASSAPRPRPCTQAAQRAIPFTSMKVVVIHSIYRIQFLLLYKLWRMGDANEDEYEKSDEID